MKHLLQALQCQTLRVGSRPIGHFFDVFCAVWVCGFADAVRFLWCCPNFCQLPRPVVGQMSHSNHSF